MGVVCLCEMGENGEGLEVEIATSSWQPLILQRMDREREMGLAVVFNGLD